MGVEIDTEADGQTNKKLYGSRNRDRRDRWSDKERKRSIRVEKETQTDGHTRKEQYVSIEQRQRQKQMNKEGMVGEQR